MKTIYKWTVLGVAMLLLYCGSVIAQEASWSDSLSMLFEEFDNVAYVDDSAHTTSNSVLAIGARADEADTDSVDEGDIGILRMSLDRRLLVDADIGVIVPGTGATNLGKAEEGTHVSGDVGIFMLSVRDDTPAATAADGEYAALLSNSTGELLVRDDDANTDLDTIAGDTTSLDNKHGTTGADADTAGTRAAQLRYIGDNIDELHVNLDNLDATASWAASTDATGITQETDHVAAHDITNSLSMDKSATVAEGSYGKTITSVDASVMAGDAVITFYVKHINFTNVANVFVRIGSSDANYEQYQVDPAEFSLTLWNHVTVPLHNGIQSGTGTDLSAITYIAFGVLMDGTQALTEIFFNDLEIHSVAAAEFQVTAGDVTSNTVRVTKVGSNAGAVWPKDAGNATNGTPRIVIADDDTNQLAQTTSLAIIDNNVLASQTLLRQTFISASLASDGVVTIVTDPAAATVPKIVSLVFTQTVQGLAEVRITGVSGTIIDQYYLPAFGGVALQMAQQPHLVGTSNESIVIKNKTGGACSYAGHVVYYLE